MPKLFWFLLFLTFGSLVAAARHWVDGNLRGWVAHLIGAVLTACLVWFIRREHLNRKRELQRILSRVTVVDEDQ